MVSEGSGLSCNLAMSLWQWAMQAVAKRLSFPNPSTTVTSTLSPADEVIHRNPSNTASYLCPFVSLSLIVTEHDLINVIMALLG